MYFLTIKNNEVRVYGDAKHCERIGAIKSSNGEAWKFKQYDCTLRWLNADEMLSIVHKLNELNTNNYKVAA